MFLYIRMAFVLLVTLYTSRVVLNTLGVEDYGVYNIVSGFVGMFGFLNTTLASSMQRFYNYEIGKSGAEGLRRVYSAGFWIHVIISALLLVVLETFGLWYINHVMVVPDGRLAAANMVFQAAVVTMLLVVMQIPYLGAVMAYEKMNVYACISIMDVVLKLAIVLMLPAIPYDKLMTYSVLLVCISVTNTAIYVFYAKSHFHGLKLMRKTGGAAFREILSFSGWNLLGTFAFMVNGQGLNLLLNSFFGTVVNAARGVAFQVSYAVTSFTNSVTAAFRPQLVDSYARDERQRVKKLFYLESKTCFSLVLVLIVPIILEVDLLLRLWLGDTSVPDQTGVFTMLVLVNTLICTVNPIIGQVAFADGRIKRYQTANSIVNILVIPTAFLLLKTGCNAVSVFIVSIAFSIVNQMVCLIEMNRLFCIDIHRYASQVILPCFSLVVIVLFPQWLLTVLMPDSIIRLLLVLLVDIVVFIPMFYWIILNKDEKTLFQQYLKSALKKNA